MLKNNKLRLFFALASVILLSACGDNDKGSQTQQFIDQVKAQTKPSPKKTSDEMTNLEGLLKSPESSIEDIKARNPFALAAAPVAEAAAGQTSRALKLLGIFTSGTATAEKRWAILRFNDKIYKVTAGEKVGESLISQINAKSVNITSTENGEEISYTLSLQEQKK